MKLRKTCSTEGIFCETKGTEYINDESSLKRGDFFEEVRVLATSSITHNFILSDKRAAERFIHAIEESEIERANRHETHSCNVKLAVSEQEILELMAKKKW